MPSTLRRGGGGGGGSLLVAAVHLRPAWISRGSRRRCNSSRSGRWVRCRRGRRRRNRIAVRRRRLRLNGGLRRACSATTLGEGTFGGASRLRCGGARRGRRDGCGRCRRRRRGGACGCGCRRLHSRARVRDDAQHQLLALIAKRQPNAIGLHVGHENAVDGVPLQERGALAAGVSRRNAVFLPPITIVPVNADCRVAAAPSRNRRAERGAGRRVGLKSVRWTVSERAAVPPAIAYSGSSDVTTGRGATGSSGGGDNRTALPKLVSHATTAAATSNGTSHHSAARRRIRNSLIASAMAYFFCGSAKSKAATSSA